MIRIYNSLTGEKQELQPITPGELRMYVCGITVYDFLHIGHARMLTVFDVVSRYLRHRGYKLTYVRNITDIDDKIIRRAAENGEPIDALTERDREALLMREEGLDYNEIAEALELSLASVGTTLSRARKRLVEAYEELRGKEEGRRIV